jgi:hypothetical protein
MTVRRILLSCLNANAGSGDIKPLSDADWQELLSMAKRFGVSPLVYRQARTLPDIPSHVTEQVRRAYIGNALRNTRMYLVLSEILTALNEKGVQTILLKGAHLAEIVYGDIGLRTMSDIDILVPKQQLNLTIQTLFQIGFCLNKSDPDMRIIADDAPPMHNHYPMLIHRKADIHLDVHCSVIYRNSPFLPDTDGLFERARPAVVNGTDAFVLDPEDLLLHLCIHTAFLNLFSNGVRALCDVTETVRHYHKDIDWRRLSKRARQWRAEKCFTLTLFFAKELMNAQVPDDGITPLPDSPEWLDFAGKQIFSLSASPEILPSLSREFGKPISAARKIAAFIWKVFPEPEYMSVMFQVPADSWRIYPCYLKRALRYLTKASRRFIQERGRIGPVIERDNTRFGFQKWLAEE